MAIAIVTIAIRRLPTPIHVNAWVRLTPGSSSSRSAAAPACKVSWVMRDGRSVVDRVDSCDADAEARENRREVLQVADRGAAPGLEVELGRHDQRITRLHDLRLQAVAPEEAAAVPRVAYGAVGAQDEHVLRFGGLVG